MTPKIDYISIPASILTRKELSDKAKMLLALIAGFRPKALMMSNPQLAKVLCCSEDYITKLLTEIKGFIRIEYPQSRYRKVFYSSEMSGVETGSLRQNERTKVDSTPSLGPATPSYRPATPSYSPVTPDKSTDIIKGTKENKITKESKETQERVDGLFEHFWKAYPRKVSKPQALKAFGKLHPDEALVDAMLDAIDRQRYTEQWAKNDGQFIPYPATWLAGRRWEDPIEDSYTGCCATREFTEEEADALYKQLGLSKCPVKVFNRKPAEIVIVG